MNKILVVAVHPDDETIGCGGTLLKLKKSGGEIHWLIATDVDESIGYDRGFVQARAAEIEKVGKAYGFSGIHRLQLPSARVETVPLGEIVRRMSNVIKTVDPDTLFLPFRGDVHSDHRIVFDAAFSCTKSFRFPSIRRLYMMETLSETEFAPAIPGHTFVPNSFVDISEMFEKNSKLCVFMAVNSLSIPSRAPWLISERWRPIAEQLRDMDLRKVSCCLKNIGRDREGIAA